MVTREQFGGLGLKTTDRTVLGFGPQNPGAVPAGIGGSTWRHREGYVKAKQICEESLAVRSTKKELDHNAPWGLSGSLHIYRHFMDV
jgi:hypothetical protein